MSVMGIIVCIGIIALGFFGVTRLETCLLYEKWKEAYIPVFEEFSSVIEQMKFYDSLPRISEVELHEFLRLRQRALALQSEVERLWSLNPRRQKKK